MYQDQLFNVQSPDKPKFTGRYIYEAKGRAREYRELACNLYTGCDHGCSYCYAPSVLQRDRQQFHETIKPRKNIIRHIDRESKKYVAAGDTRQVLLCFATDPYNKMDETYKYTRQAISTLHKNGMPVCVLTKGGSRSLRDIDLFTEKDSYAVTLTTLDDEKSLEWEPGAAVTSDRIRALHEFHNKGIPTWVSLEPVLDPQDVLWLIHVTHEIVDEFKVGVLNYHPRAKEIDWHKFAHDVVEYLEKLDQPYYLKHDLRKYLN